MTTRCITCWIHTCCALSSSRGFYQLYPSILSLPFDLSSSRSRSIPSESSNDETLDYYINNAANSVYCVFLSRSLTSILFLSLSYSFTSLLLIAHTRNFSLSFFLFLSPSSLSLFHTYSSSFTHRFLSYSLIFVPSLSFFLICSLFFFLLTRSLFSSLLLVQFFVPLSLTLSFPSSSSLPLAHSLLLSWRLAAGRELESISWRTAARLDEISRARCVYTRVCTRVSGWLPTLVSRPSR